MVRLPRAGHLTRCLRSRDSPRRHERGDQAPHPGHVHFNTRTSRRAASPWPITDRRRSGLRGAWRRAHRPPNAPCRGSRPPRGRIVRPDGRDRVPTRRHGRGSKAGPSACRSRPGGRHRRRRARVAPALAFPGRRREPRGGSPRRTARRPFRLWRRCPAPRRFRARHRRTTSEIDLEGV